MSEPVPDYIDELTQRQRERWEQLAGRFAYEDEIDTDTADYRAYRIVIMEDGND